VKVRVARTVNGVTDAEVVKAIRDAIKAWRTRETR
jgi:hypothetical protein